MRLIDMTGNRYGKLTVIKRDTGNDNPNVHWLCKCDCGNIKSINGSNLRHGRIKSCGCIYHPYKDNMIGNRFGQFIVLSEHGKAKDGHTQYLCRCECGTEKIIAGNLLVTGKTKSCGCSRRTGSVKHMIYHAVQRHTENRNLCFELTEQQVMDIVFCNCFYCGCEGSNTIRNTYEEIKWNGLDRIDSSKGYTIDNVVPCCKYCNQAKNNLTQDEFYDWIKRVVKHLQIA